MDFPGHAFQAGTQHPDVFHPGRHQRYIHLAVRIFGLELETLLQRRMCRLSQLRIGIRAGKYARMAIEHYFKDYFARKEQAGKDSHG